MITHKSHFYKIIIPQHLLGIAAIATLFFESNLTWLWATFVAWFLCYVMGEGIFLHRYFSHRAFETHPWIAKIFAVFALLGGFGSPISYRAVHIGMHHAHSDTDKDSHSPIHGFWHAWILWHLTSIKPPLVICKNLLRDKFYVWLETNIIKVWWGALIVLTLIDWRLPLFTLGLAGAIGMNMAGITNSLAHMVGTRRFDTDDNSRNIAWLSWLTWQGSSVLQNNHHAKPSRYHDSHAWYELDIGKWIIPLIATKVHYQE
jgi:fatty-acid desaturase